MTIIAANEHSAEETAAHTVVTVIRPGTYHVSGTLPKGQLAVDLGGDAGDDPDAVVTLILDAVSITCTVAPAGRPSSHSASSPGESWRCWCMR